MAPPPVLPPDGIDPDEGEPTVIVSGYGRRTASDVTGVGTAPVLPTEAPEYRPYRTASAVSRPTPSQPLEPPRPKTEPPRPKSEPSTPNSESPKTPPEAKQAAKPVKPAVSDDIKKDDIEPDTVEVADTEDKPRARWKSWLIDIGVVVLGAMVLTSVLRLFVYQAFNVPTGSMEQTLQKNDSIVAVKLLDFNRGDIVVFEDAYGWLKEAPEEPGPIRSALEFIGLLPSTTTQHLVKRVIGLPGDRVWCCDANGLMNVNGVALDESEYLYSYGGNVVAPSNIVFDITVPKDTIFVMGDHRNVSGDSRFHLCDVSGEAGVPRGMAAFIPIESVVGKVVAISSPWSHMTWFSTPEAFANVPAPGPPPDAPVITKISLCQP
jgi:signal peptidase I